MRFLVDGPEPKARRPAKKYAAVTCADFHEQFDHDLNEISVPNAENERDGQDGVEKLPGHSAEMHEHQ